MLCVYFLRQYGNAFFLYSQIIGAHLVNCFVYFYRISQMNRYAPPDRLLPLSLLDQTQTTPYPAAAAVDQQVIKLRHRRPQYHLTKSAPAHLYTLWMALKTIMNRFMTTTSLQ